VIPTHFHDDCLGGLKAFHDQEIPSYANTKTLELATQEKSAIPQQGFYESMTLHVGDKTVEVKFFGEGHTRDNVVGYFPSERVLFGGCLIKEVDASKGYLADANIKAWPTTVEKVKRAYPNVQLVIPGHGAYGGPELLDYTVGLFRGE
jgi:metallo-beta-lactamase class B